MLSLQEIAGRFDGISWRGKDSFQCRCPCHDDKQASLTVSDGEKGIVLCCHAGCLTENILSAIDLTFADISPEPSKSVTEKRFDFGNIIATYDYRNGTRKLRDGNKHFLWQHQEPDGSWKSGRGKAPHVLYKAGADQQTVYICEGEKDADNLSQLGFYAVSSENGAGNSGKKWFSEYTAELTEKDCVLIPDNDSVGKEFMRFVAAEISGKTNSVKVLSLTDTWQALPEKGDVSDLIEHFGSDDAKRLLLKLSESTEVWTPFISTSIQKSRRGRSGAEYNGDLKIDYLWYPFLPLDEYTVVFGASGTGKTFYLALLCAYVTTGKALPCDDQTRKPGTVLYISAEESFEEIMDRITKAGGDKKQCVVIDRVDSLGLNLDSGFDEMTELISSYHPDLVVLDPWQTFLGATVDMNRANMLRPILQKLSLLAKKTHSAVVVVSHINKKSQGDDANFAATGSNELINASRSAVRLIEDENDNDRRIAVHTKSNHARRGKSVCFRFTDSGVRWDGISDIDKATLEEAARKRQTPGELKKSKDGSEEARRKLVSVLIEESRNTENCGIRLTYEDMRLKYGANVFNGMQPKRMLDNLTEELLSRGIYVKTGIDVRRGEKHFNGFFIQRILSDP